MESKGVASDRTPFGVIRSGWRGTALVFLLLCAGAAPAAAEVRVLVGPTPIVKGDARAAGDITVVNEHLAFALAVQSAVPYGVPRGALIDLAPVVNGTIGRDRVVFADFIPDNWSAWPNTYQHVDIVERGPERAVIRTTRDWGKVTVVTLYTLAADADHVGITVTMTNGGAAALTNLKSGLTLWPNSGFYFGVPGMQGVAEGRTAAAPAHRAVAYDEDWSIALHADYFDYVGDESKDLYLSNTLAPGQSRSFEGWLEVSPSGDLAPVMRAEIERRHLAAGTVQGLVLDHDNRVVDSALVMVEKGGLPYAWVMGHAGHYEMLLPQGDYTLYATGRNYSQSRRAAVTVRSGATQTRDFHDLQRPGRIEFGVTDSQGAPLDARIVITAGQQPFVEFLGRRTFFTELERQGRVDVPIAPGRYEFSVASGDGFLGPVQRVALEVSPNSVQTAKVVLDRLFDPPARGWYAADLHHHADQAEAVTPPADLARSELAAGLDLLFVSDHDSTVNHAALQKIAGQRGIPFVPGVELSPSWGHFNAYPLTPGESPAIDTSVASVDAIIKEARRLGAIVVQVNHPFIPYGYFTSVAAGVAPGGFNPGFDLMEINESAPEDDDRVLHALWDFWNAGHRYYLSAGTDTHDVWNSRSGHVRVLAHVDGPLTAVTYAEALQAGHAYVTHGPLIFPDVVFGGQLRVKPDASFNLGFDLKSVEGLKSVELIGAGTVAARRSFAGAPREARVDFPLQAARATWYALIVEDVRGQRAFTNPIWIDPVRYPP
jgi:hypothetical protein